MMPRYLQKAIRACLEVPWLAVGEKVDLGNQDTSSGFYEHVIQKLDEELVHLLGSTF
jgi:hypothetical protein